MYSMLSWQSCQARSAEAGERAELLSCNMQVCMPFALQQRKSHNMAQARPGKHLMTCVTAANASHLALHSSLPEREAAA